MVCDALFNNYCFLGIFLPVVLAVFWALRGVTARQLWLAIASLTFYSFWDVRFSLLLLVTCVVDFSIALKIHQSTKPRVWLATSVVYNLGVLAVFKYTMFAAASARSLFSLVGLPIELPYFYIVLPVGISFFTFQSMSYTIDVYRRHVEPTRSFLHYLTFVSLFPQLVAGPIVRYSQLSDQLSNVQAPLIPKVFQSGIPIFALGLFKKVAVADTIATVIDPLWANASHLTAAEAWMAALGYTFQLYFDFSGYSDMAIGLARFFGLEFPINFNAPYQALNPTDFWRRWHISLSSFLGDYLYKPLGGNRISARRTDINLLIVMVLGGLWHGANWTFVAWGAYHGILLVAYKRTRTKWDAAPKALQRAVMFLSVVIGWVLFRAPNIPTALRVYQAMFAGSLAGAVQWLPHFIALVALLAFAMTVKRTHFALRPIAPRALLWATLVAISLVLLRSQDSPFLYYQF